jgi:hypothetical protein
MGHRDGSPGGAKITRCTIGAPSGWHKHYRDKHLIPTMLLVEQLHHDPA